MELLVDIVRLGLFPALMAFAASSDLLTMTISNRISMLLVAGFAILAVMIGMPLELIGWHLAAAGTVLVVTFTFFACGWIGGGDAKLAAATALWLGFDHLTAYLLYASLFGGALTLFILKFRRLPLPARLAHQDWIMRLHGSDNGVPYGIALAVAALCIYPATIWMKTPAF